MKTIRMRLLAGLALLLLGSVPAQAALQITYQVDLFAPVTLSGPSGGDVGCSTTGTVTCNGHGIFKLSSIDLSSNSPGESAFTYLLTDLKVASISSGGGTHRLQVWLGDTDFIAPITSPKVMFDSEIGGDTGGSKRTGNSLRFLSCVDVANGQNTCPTGVPFPYTAVGNPDTTLSSWSDDQDIWITSLGPSAYSVSQYIDIHLASKNIMSFGASTTLSSVVPEPVSIALLGGLLLLSSGLIRRRAKGGSAV